MATSVINVKVSFDSEIEVDVLFPSASEETVVLDQEIEIEVVCDD